MKKLLLIFLIIAIANLGFTQNKVTPFELPLFANFPNVRDLTISPVGNELYFTVQTVKQDFSVIMVSYKIDGKWSKPSVATFSGQYKDLEPFVSPDGLTMYFASNRPIAGSEEEKQNFDIWKSSRTHTMARWQAPINMGAPINTNADEFYPSVASNGNLYFTTTRVGGQGKEDIYVCKFEDDGYSKPFVLPSQINSSGYEFNAFIAPDESYILFTGYKRDDGYGGGDLYISKRLSEGIWMPAENLGKGLNSQGLDYCPFVQNGVLYFTSNRSAIKSNYKKPLTTKELLAEFNKLENGKSRIYRVEWTGSNYIDK